MILDNGWTLIRNGTSIVNDQGRFPFIAEIFERLRELEEQVRKAASGE